MAQEQQSLKHQVALLGYMIGFFSVAGALVLVGWQVYTWLRLSVWPSRSAIWGLEWLGLEWARRPTDWLGLYRLLDMVPLAVVIAVVGGVVGSIIYAVADE